MRITLTLDADVAKLLAEAVRRERRSSEEIVNDSLRRGLSMSAAIRKPSRFRIVAHHTKLMPGFDHAHSGALADRLEDDSLLRRAKKRKRT